MARHYPSHAACINLGNFTLTTSSEQQDILSGYGLGANSYIRKPVDFNKLSEVLKETGLYLLVVTNPHPGVSEVPDGKTAPVADHRRR